MPAITVEDVLACPALPSLPAVAVKVLELTRDEKINLDTIAQVIQSDPALTAKILRTVNSTFYALPSPCRSVPRALGYLGMNTVKSLILGFSLVEFSGKTTPGFDEAGFWKRCLYAAAGARRIARMSSKCDPEEAFAAGLMQDLGVLGLVAANGNDYGAVYASTNGDHQRLPAAERDAFGFDHAEIGAMMGERWRLPDELIAAIRHHHDVDCSEYEHLVRSVALGSEVATAMTHAEPGESLGLVREHAEKWFGFCISDVNGMVQDISDDVSELSKQLEIDAGDPIDVNWLLSQAVEATVNHQLAMEREANTLRRTNDELTKIAQTDGLTGVGNRKRFDEELASRYQQAEAFKGNLGLILIDADRFKLLNDTHGHQAGDEVLVELAARLNKAVRNIDVVCRYGGEEFAVLLPGASLKDTAAIAERLRVTVEGAAFDLGNVPGAPADVKVTVSLGAAVYNGESARVFTTQGLLVKAADQALYVAKQGGRNCVRVFRVDAASSDAA
ncbi:MAG: sensor domain-containing diguanylate cyclase [Planctomycetota bacterium]|jgi:diguanylate cyclase (GGDEF)-like protein